MSRNMESLSILQRAQLAWNLMRDDRVASWVKKAGPAVILAYIVSPVDVIPDFLLGAGQVDDFGVLAIGLVLLVRLLVRFAPQEVVDEHITRVTGFRGAERQPRRSRTDGPTIDTSGRVR